MHCQFTPYHGTEPYIFVSYCHEDAATVYPFLERLYLAGYRIWYDSGIAPGMEWPQEIANRIANSTVFLAFMSPAASESHNCRKEISFAIFRNIKMTAFFLAPLEKCGLTTALEMQLSNIQHIILDYNQPMNALERLMNAELLKDCLGTPDESFTPMPLPQRLAASGVPVGAALYRYSNQELIVLEDRFVLGRKHPCFGSAYPQDTGISREHVEFFWQDGRCFIKDLSKHNLTHVNRRRIPAGQAEPLECGDSLLLGIEANDERFLFLCGNIRTPDDARSMLSKYLDPDDGVGETSDMNNSDDSPTMDFSSTGAALYRYKTGDMTYFEDALSLGRKHPVFGPDYPANRGISRDHATFSRQGRQYSVTDVSKLNLVKVNETRIPAGKAVPLNCGDVLQLGAEENDERFLFLCGGFRGERDAQRMLQYTLERPDTNETIPLTASPFICGRSSRCHYVMPKEDAFIGAEHAALIRKGSACYVKDLLSRNHTFVNGEEVAGDTTRQVVVNDEIRLANIKFRLDVRVLI